MRSNAIEVFSNQDVPFESVLNELNLRREKDRSPLFQVMVAMQPPRAASVSSEINVSPAVLTPRGLQFDITLVAWREQRQVKLTTWVGECADRPLRARYLSSACSSTL